MKKNFIYSLTLILLLTIFNIFYPIENAKGETLYVGDELIREDVSTMYIYTSEGNFTVNLTVIDSNGEKSSNTTFVNIIAQTDDQNGGEGKDGKIPGFETVFVILAVAFILFYKRKIVK